MSSERLIKLQAAQEKIYLFFLKLVRHDLPETVLANFKNFFLFGVNPIAPDVQKALYEIIIDGDETLFKNTFKRTCYIITNNWTSESHSQYIHHLVEIIGEVSEHKQTVSRSLNCLRTWIGHFIESKDYQEIQELANYYSRDFKKSWHQRYTSFLLVPQYLNLDNPQEQREIAKKLSDELKEKYKADLARYSLHDSHPEATIPPHDNPTHLGQEAIALVKNIVVQNLVYSYENHSRRFIEQVRDFNYEEFKTTLPAYLIFGIPNQRALELLDREFAAKLKGVYPERNENPLSLDLFLRSCRRAIEFLTVEDGTTPSKLFILMSNRENALSLAIVLLKIILICKYARLYLEVCIAKLIQYYEKVPEKECRWFIYFLEVFNIVFSLYTDDISYNLVRVRNSASGKENAIDLDAYRIFPQLKSMDLRENDLSNSDLRGQNLSAADLRKANLRGTDLSDTDLSLAKFSRAQLNNATLSRADLVAADLCQADLQNANLQEAILRHSLLRQAQLMRANLSRARLKQADLTEANLSFALLKQADLSHANLTAANLTGASLSRANLTGANLAGANLRGANFMGANLTGANLKGATFQGTCLRRTLLVRTALNGATLDEVELSYANLTDADLSEVTLSNSHCRHAKIDGANLTNARLIETNFFRTKLHRAQFSNTRFEKCLGISSLQQQKLAAKGGILRE